MSPKPRRRWYQFSLSTLLIGLTLFSLPLGYVAWEREQCRRGEEALTMLALNASPASRAFECVPSARPNWLKELLGNDQFRYVNSAELNGESITDSDLQQLAALPNLRNVRIESRYLTDEGVTFLRGLQNVEKFCFIRNRRVAGISWGFLERWHHLRTLSFEDSDFCHDSVPKFSAITSLRELDLSQSNITAAGLDLGSLPANLEVLNLSSTEVTDADLQQLCHLDKLRTLDLSSTYVRAAWLAQLPAPSNLQSLNLNGCKLAEGGPVAIASLTSLKNLQLVGVGLTDPGMAPLAELTNLEFLDLSYNQISDKGLLHLCRLKRLKKVALEETQVSDAGMEKLHKSLPDVAISVRTSWPR